MEENKDTTVYENMLMEIINLENEVNRIYYLGADQFAVAEEFEKEVRDVKDNFLKKSSRHKNIIVNQDFDEIIDKYTELKFKIQAYFDREGTDIENERTRERYIRKTDEIAQATEKKSIAELWDGVRKIVEDWKIECKDHTRFEVEQYEMNKIVAKAVLRILESQAINGEKINLDPVEDVCSRNDLVEAIREKLIQMAKKNENSENRTELLDTAKYLTEERLNEPEVWEQLTGVQNVKTNQTQTMAIVKATPKDISKPKKSSLKERFAGKTIYTLGDIDPDTGEWINVEEVRGRFPKRFSSKDAKRVLKMEINGVKEVKESNFHHFGLADVYPLPKFENMQELVLGDDVEKLERGTFQRYENLKKVEIGKKITTIPESCFECCYNLQIVNLKKGVERLKKYSFALCKNLKHISIPDTVEIINNDAFCATRNADVEIGDSVKMKLNAYLGVIQNGRIDRTMLDRVRVAGKKSSKKSGKRRKNDDIEFE